VRSALIPNVTALPTMLYIVRFGPYRPHGFVPGDASSLSEPNAPKRVQHVGSGCYIWYQSSAGANMLYAFWGVGLRSELASPGTKP
jgi:hypothetical protein